MDTCDFGHSDKTKMANIKVFLLISPTLVCELGVIYKNMLTVDFGVRL